MGWPEPSPLTIVIVGVSRLKSFPKETQLSMKNFNLTFVSFKPCVRIMDRPFRFKWGDSEVGEG